MAISWVKFAGQVLFGGSLGLPKKALDFNGVLQSQRAELLGTTSKTNSTVF